MAKNKERKIAYEMYVHQLKTAKEIAEILGVQEKTVGEWVKKGGWKEEREARANSTNNGREAIKKVISNLAERRIEIADLRKMAESLGDKKEVIAFDMEAASIADQVSKMNAALRSYDKENVITATIYLEIMEDIFNALRLSDEKLHIQTLDFQEMHALFVVKKYG